MNRDSPSYMHAYLYRLAEGVGNVGFSTVQVDKGGISLLSRTVVLDQNMGWHAQV